MLSQADAAEGVRTFRRQPGADEVARVLELFDIRYRDFNARHFHEKLVACVRRSYNWVRLTLQGRTRAAPRRGAHRRKRPRRVLPGLHGSRWTPGRQWASPDATSGIHSAFFVAEESTMSSFRALQEVERGLFRSLCTGSHCFRTPEAGGKVDKDNPTQAGRALRQLGHAYSPEARERRMFGTLQKRLPQELRLAADMAEANRFLKQVYLPDRRFPLEELAFVPFAGALDDILCVQRIVSNDNTVRCKGHSLQADRHHYVKARVRVHEYPDHALAVFHGPGRLARADGSPLETRKAA